MKIILVSGVNAAVLFDGETNSVAVLSTPGFKKERAVIRRFIKRYQEKTAKPKRKNKVVGFLRGE